MKFLTIILFSSLATFSWAFESRSWMDSQNRTIEAVLLRGDAQTVILKLPDGREVPFPLEKLSLPDREYVEKNRPIWPTMEILEKPATAFFPKKTEVQDGLNFDQPWPERIKFSEDPEVKIIEENNDKKRFVYESSNYRYVSDVRLSQSVVKGFAVMFEATYLYCRSLPLGLNGGDKTDGKHLILLFENVSDYVKAGGPPDSAGVFMGGRGIVMVPLTSLGVRPVGSSYMLDRDKCSKTLPHELTHQLTPPSYFRRGAVGWFSEGIAEYVAVTPYRAGVYSVRGNIKDIVAYVTGFGAKDLGGRALGAQITLPPLKEFLLQDYAKFFSNPQINYGSGLLITTYFFHLDGDGDAKRIKGFLKKLHQDESGDAPLELLLDGRTFEQLEADIVREWSKKGVDFTFEKS